jgi:hypothetical protein
VHRGGGASCLEQFVSTKRNCHMGFLLIVLLVCVVVCQQLLVVQAGGTITLERGRDTVTIRWDLLPDDVISFDISVDRVGWLAFGVSPTGNMAESDVAIALPDQNRVGDFFIDEWSLDGVVPDNHNDLIDASFQQDGTSTRLLFKRKLVSEDQQQDFDIIKVNLALWFRLSLHRFVLG